MKRTFKHDVMIKYEDRIGIWSEGGTSKNPEKNPRSRDEKQ